MDGQAGCRRDVRFEDQRARLGQNQPVASAGLVLVAAYLDAVEPGLRQGERGEIGIRSGATFQIVSLP